jgi:chemotaxis protein methyltransferase CheR
MSVMKLEDRDFKRIKEFMLANYGLNFENKSTLIEGRLSNLIAKQGFSNFHDYFESVLKDPTDEKLSILITKLTTNYTHFMREPRHYEFLKGSVLPELEKRVRGGELRIWSAGCSSGEEPYTIAITVKSYLESSNTGLNARILATDISDNVLAQAKAAVYTQIQLGEMEQALKDKYFVKLSDGRYQVSDVIRSMVRFDKFNLMKEFGFSFHKYHVIFCRNVMIYFKNDTKQMLANKFFDQLEPGGYLFIGLSETLHNIDTRFEYIKPAVYRRPI